MDVHLWEWSSAVQIASALIIAVFFAVPRSSIGRAEIRWWMRACSIEFSFGVTTLTPGVTRKKRCVTPTRRCTSESGKCWCRSSSVVEFT